ncbi:MAG TPA: flagellar biosynthesis protein FlhF [Phycisphaerae bacterium]|nr:flagellar biosynthesis protein FlhF [Phycisphaerae bacterium]
MNLRTYQGNSMAEALDKVKEDLGRDAVILHTRTVKRGGLWGVGARTVVEITASRDVRDLPAAERRAMGVREARLEGTGAETAVGVQSRPAARVIPPLQGYAYRPPESLRAGMGTPSATTDASDGLAGRRGGWNFGRLIRPDAGEHEDFTRWAAGLKDEMNEIRTMVRQLMNRPRAGGGPLAEEPADAAPAQPREPETPAELQEYYTRLLQNAVADEVAREIIATARDRLADCRERIRAGVGDRVGDIVLNEKIQSKLRELIPAVMMETVERMLPPPGPVEVEPGAGPKIVALVGPTGVGKTTTIAKLAAHFKLREGKRVGLITTDTYRIAAVDQLRAYADIMSLPLEVVLTPEELTQAIERLGPCDLILIDTSGRSHRDAQRLGDLKAFLEAVRMAVAEAGKAGQEDAGKRRKGRRTRAKAAGGLPAGVSLEVHLLLSCACDQAQLLQVAERFSMLGVDRAVFTKLDEAVGLGVVLNVARRLDMQLSYLTTGQDVPDDIEVGHRRSIAERLLKGEAEAAVPAALPDAPAVDQLA